MRTSPFLPLAALLLLAGCNRDAASDAATTAAAPAAAPAAPAAPAAGDDAGVTMRYACDGNTTVAILGSDTARVDLPDGSVLMGRAVDLDDHGRLMVETGEGTVAVAAGDVVHVRPTE